MNAKIIVGLVLIAVSASCVRKQVRMRDEVYFRDLVVLSTDSAGFQGAALAFGIKGAMYLVDTATLRLVSDTGFQRYLSDATVQRILLDTAVAAIAGKNVVYAMSNTLVFGHAITLEDYSYIGVVRQEAPRHGAAKAAEDALNFLTSRFPWPPPAPTAAWPLSGDVCAGGPGTSLGAVAADLERRMRQSDVPEWGYYAIGEDGFAVVTGMVQLVDTGIVKPPVRERRQLINPLALVRAQELKQLLLARSSSYLVLVIAVTPQPYEAAPTSMSLDAARELAKRGRLVLPKQLANTMAGDVMCTVLLYQYNAPNEVDVPKLAWQPHYAIVEVLSKVRLWNLEELTR